MACVAWQVPTTVQVEACHASLDIERSFGHARTTKSKGEAIVSTYHSGQNAATIARRFGVHRHTVARALRSAGIPPRGSLLTEDLADSVRSFYDTGNTVAQTASHFGVGKNTMIAFMDEHGIVRRDRTAGARRRG